jgi:hypothetical protein
MTARTSSGGSSSGATGARGRRRSGRACCNPRVPAPSFRDRVRGAHAVLLIEKALREGRIHIDPEGAPAWNLKECERLVRAGRKAGLRFTKTEIEDFAAELMDLWNQHPEKLREGLARRS